MPVHGIWQALPEDWLQLGQFPKEPARSTFSKDVATWEKLPTSFIGEINSHAAPKPKASCPRWTGQVCEGTSIAKCTRARWMPHEEKPKAGVKASATAKSKASGGDEVSATGKSKEAHGAHGGTGNLVPTDTLKPEDEASATAKSKEAHVSEDLVATDTLSKPDKATISAASKGGSGEGTLLFPYSADQATAKPLAERIKEAKPQEFSEQDFRDRVVVKDVDGLPVDVNNPVDPEKFPVNVYLTEPEVQETAANPGDAGDASEVQETALFEYSAEQYKAKGLIDRLKEEPAATDPDFQERLRIKDKDGGEMDKNAISTIPDENFPIKVFLVDPGDAAEEIPALDCVMNKCMCKPGSCYVGGQCVQDGCHVASAQVAAIESVGGVTSPLAQEAALRAGRNLDEQALQQMSLLKNSGDGELSAPMPEGEMLSAKELREAAAAAAASSMKGKNSGAGLTDDGSISVPTYGGSMPVLVSRGSTQRKPEMTLLMNKMRQVSEKLEDVSNKTLASEGYDVPDGKKAMFAARIDLFLKQIEAKLGISDLDHQYFAKVLKASQDFPIGCTVKAASNSKEGKVIGFAMDSENPDEPITKVKVEFEEDASKDVPVATSGTQEVLPVATKGATKKMPGTDEDAPPKKLTVEVMMPADLKVIKGPEIVLQKHDNGQVMLDAGGSEDVDDATHQTLTIEWNKKWNAYEDQSPKPADLKGELDKFREEKGLDNEGWDLEAKALDGKVVDVLGTSQLNKTAFPLKVVYTKKGASTTHPEIVPSPSEIPAASLIAAALAPSPPRRSCSSRKVKAQWSSFFPHASLVA